MKAFTKAIVKKAVHTVLGFSKICCGYLPFLFTCFLFLGEPDFTELQESYNKNL